MSENQFHRVNIVPGLYIIKCKGNNTGYAHYDVSYYYTLCRYKG